MPQIGVPELLLILLVLVLLFGAKKLPETARALGQSLRLFKKETSKLNEEEEQPAAKAQQQAQALPPGATPSVEERLRALEEENRRLRAAVEASGTTEANKDQRPS